MDKVFCANYNSHDPIDRILKRQSERRKPEEKNNLDLTNFEEIERFTEDFSERQKEIESNFQLTETMERDKLFQHFTNLNEQIQTLQRFYSNATIFLRIYDKKICQAALHSLQGKLKELENRLLPKKKFGFKSRKNKFENSEVEVGVKKIHHSMKPENYMDGEICGFCRMENQNLILQGGEIEKRDVLLADMKNCTVRLQGNPSTVHMANLVNCQIYCGPVSTSAFVERVKDSCLHLACQQLRVHETVRTDFFIHVTSRAIIEDSKEVRFGMYKLSYEGIEEDYQKSGLNQEVNNWDKIDDFNWLAIDKPSPNWSTMTDQNFPCNQSIN